MNGAVIAAPFFVPEWRRNPFPCPSPSFNFLFYALAFFTLFMIARNIQAFCLFLMEEEGLRKIAN